MNLKIIAEKSYSSTIETEQLKLAVLITILSVIVILEALI